MRVEKQGYRGEGGRYVGGFLHLFDWNAKSRKKLFSRTPDLSEQSKQKKSSNTNMPNTQFHPANEDYMADSLSLKGSNDYSCASSLIDEDDYGKAPGVVARLMGLDSLPTSNFSDTHSNPFFDSRSLRDSSAIYVRKSLELEQKDYHQMQRKHRVIEKFQTESLPPKSARSVPITQHKLLSPIKSSGFVSSDDPARIMEAASKIPLVGSSSLSSSVPFSARKPSKISQSCRKPVESNAARNLKGQSMNKSWDGCLEPKPFRVLEEEKKSISLALQAKVNIKKREGSSLSGRRSLYGGESINSQPNRQRSTLKKPSTNTVLKQNNQKQNSLLDRGKSAAKSSVSSTNSQCRKPVSEKCSSKISMNFTNKTVNRRKGSMEDGKNRVRDKHDISGDVVKSNGSDVVSFTFTSPILRSIPTPMNSAEKKNTFLADGHGKNPLVNFEGNNNSLNLATGGDSLSTLLDQKLRELTAMSSTSVSQESSTTDRARINRTPIFQDKRNRDRFSKDDLCSGFSSNDPQVAEETSEYRKLLGDQHPSLISLTRPSFLAESCISSDTANAYGTEVFSKKSTMMEIDTKLSDSVGCTETEPGYVKDILSDIEFMFEDFALGRTRKIVNPRLFGQLEAQRPVLEKQGEPQLRRKLVFDCVSECVDSRCRVWTQGLAAVRRKDWLAEEACNKISGWEQMKDCMVDEFVDKDMSDDQRKKWLNFDVEAFELGVEIERQILDSLINEAVADILVQ